MMRCWVRSGIWALLLGCFLSATYVGVAWYRALYRPMLRTPFVVVFDKHASAVSLVRFLKNQHAITSESVLLDWIRWRGLSSRLQAGVYDVKAGESAASFLSRVVRGDVLVLSFSIIEGTTLAQVSKALEHASYLSYDANDWSMVTEGHSSAEGLLLADTYRYDAGSGSQSLLLSAHRHLQNVLNDAWQHRASSLPYQTPYELLIVASILEKETAIARERRLISGVIINRLQKHMLLQMDPTVIYAKGADAEGRLMHDDLRLDSPYNTYRYHGLPPTPIAMVGKDAIDAAAHPLSSNYLYFVAMGDGHHYFSETYDEQKAAVARYLGGVH